MIAFTPDEWLILLLVFLLGLFLGMAAMASPKWKRRYRAEAARREGLEVENAELRREADEKDSLRHAAARDEERRRLAIEAERDAAEERAAIARTRPTTAEPDRDAIDEAETEHAHIIAEERAATARTRRVATEAERRVNGEAT
jgi:hypothetical protein